MFLLVQILKENKDKKDAEFNERFKHSELCFFFFVFPLELTNIYFVIVVVSILDALERLRCWILKL